MEEIKKLSGEAKEHLLGRIIPFWRGLRDDANGGWYGYMSYGLETDRNAVKGCILNSRITLILMHVGFSLSMATFMFHGAIHTNIPMELEEAAFLDGCSRWQTYWKIVFPLLKPTIATVAIIDAMAFWNDYLLPSLVLGRKELYTLPIATQAFYGTYSTDLGLVMAALLLAMLPILILYLFLQRYIVEGVTSGAVKG